MDCCAEMITELHEHSPGSLHPSFLPHAFSTFLVSDILENESQSQVSRSGKCEICSEKSKNLVPIIDHDVNFEDGNVLISGVKFICPLCVEIMDTEGALESFLNDEKFTSRVGNHFSSVYSLEFSKGCDELQASYNVAYALKVFSRSREVWNICCGKWESCSSTPEEVKTFVSRLMKKHRLWKK